jgi:hypothetical protein
MRFTSEAISINGTAVGGTGTVDISPGIVPAPILTDGGVDPEMVSALRADNRAMFTIHDIETMLGIGFIGGVALNGTTGLTAYARPITAGSTRAAAGSVKILMASGMVVNRSLTASVGEYATLTCEGIGTSASAATAPIQISASSDALLAPTKTQLFTLGPVSINSSTVTGLQSWGLQFGIAETVEAGAGSPYSDFVGIAGRMPVFTFASTNSGLLTTYGAAPVAVTALTFYLRACVAGGSVSADASAVHGKFTVSKGLLHLTSVGGAGMAVHGTILPYYAAGANIIVYTANSAIT